MAKRKPNQVTVKRQGDGEEAIWFDDCLDRKERAAVIGHRPGQDFVTLTVINEDSTPKQTMIFIQRALLRKLLPYLTEFADGGNFGIRREATF